MGGLQPCVEQLSQGAAAVSSWSPWWGQGGLPLLVLGRTQVGADRAWPQQLLVKGKASSLPPLRREEGAEAESR